MEEQNPGPSFLEKGKELFQRGKFKEAASVFAQAAEAFQASEDALSAAEARNNQSVALLQDRKYDEALAAVAGTDKVFAASADVRRQGMALANQASVLDALKRYAEAIDLYEQSAVMLEQAGEQQMRADVLRSLAALQAKRGKFTQMVYAEQDGLLGVEKPTFKQRILKFLMKFVFWKWKRK
jgi:tetratricopeptide (TPR) repeat protein